MKVSEFINKTVDEGCSWAKGRNDAGDPGYFIRNQRLNTINHFTPQAVLKNEWASLWKCVVQGKDVEHMARVCGYFSRMSNWNASKRAEAKDRHAGNYSVK